MPSSITRLTALDHDRLHRLIRRACAPGPSRERWRDELVHLARAHLTAEQEALSDHHIAAASPAAVTAWDGDLNRLSEELEQGARALAELPNTSGELAQIGITLQRTLTLHSDVLAEQVLRPLDAAVARKEMRRLGGVYADSRERALRAQGEAEPPPRRLDLSRAELYELAKKASIQGRSAMSRRDLIAELQRRQQTR